MNNIEKRLEAIEKRNLRIEKDKAWETSIARRATITMLTYVVVLAYLIAIGNDRPLLNALVPTAGYFLSTIALNKVRSLWQK